MLGDLSMRVKIGFLTTLAILSVFITGIVRAQENASSNEVYSPDLFKGLKYRMVGPSRGGRVTAVAGHREQPSTFYMGACGGGVWKTTNYGSTWKCVSDGFFATGSIGAIRVADSDPNVVYVSTGSDGLRSNVIIGKGVYKSTDAGKTWTLLGLEKTGNSRFESCVKIPAGRDCFMQEPSSVCLYPSMTDSIGKVISLIFR
jgi:hypothetical protein